MTHTYNISGMTCNGCVAKVKSELLKLDGVESADVQLEAPQAIITMQRHIPIATLQTAIGKYMISEAGMSMQDSTAAVEEGKDSYYPIFLIFAYIFGVTFLIWWMQGSFPIIYWMDYIMAGFFLVFSFFKLLNLKAFAEAYGTYDIIASRIKVYGYIYPFIELYLGLCYISRSNLMATNIATLIIMSISTIGVIQKLMRKERFQCACLGTIIKLPLSKVTLFEDLLMVAMSAMMIWHFSA